MVCATESDRMLDKKTKPIHRNREIKRILLVNWLRELDEVARVRAHYQIVTHRCRIRQNEKPATFLLFYSNRITVFRLQVLYN